MNDECSALGQHHLLADRAGGPGLSAPTPVPTMAGATKLIATAIAKPLSTIVSKAMQYSSTGARSGFYEPKLRSRIGIGAFVADQFGRGDIGLRRRQMNNFDSNRAIHGDMN